VVSGTVRINGVETTNHSPRESRTAGLAYVPEERMREGAIGDFSVWENLILLNHGEPSSASRGFLQMRAIRKQAQNLVSSYAVKTPSLDTPARSLSGGNIQKMIMAREMSAAAAVLVVAQPTRGVDIGAAEYIHARLVDARAAGVGILLISGDLEEVLGMSDRIGVMFEGRLVAMLERSDCTAERLGLLMAGETDTERRTG
jgi:ABC-type uncharacterized transport system ATPase subunit